MTATIVGKIEIRPVTHIHCARCQRKMVPLNVKHCNRCKDDIRREVDTAWRERYPYMYMDKNEVWSRRG